MKRRLYGWLFAVVLIPSTAWADALPSVPHIAVVGHAERQVRPDVFEIAVTVAQQGTSVPELTRTVESATRQVVEAMRASGLRDADIQATNLRINPQYRYDNENQRQVFTGNEAARDITGRFPDLQKLNRFLDSIPAGEVIRIGGITPSLSGQSAVEAELLDEAVTDSKRSAEDLVNRYGQRVTGVYSISDRPAADGYVPAYRAKMMTAADGGVGRVLSEGTIKVEKDVYVVFLMGTK